MNFTKEYIELCKNEKIQGLREEFEVLDRYTARLLTNKSVPEFAERIGMDSFIYVDEYGLDDETDREDCIWLPTGDQLDDEIVKICKDKKRSYELCYTTYDKWTCWIYTSEGYGVMNTVEDNPLIAKIKLLIKLLEATSERV